ncbi:MAG: single-stranded DNA-binding protein [Actinomycetota bacterium]|nr:single-stranded DNA-binding protein [Actinomycetota bacterium]
MASVNRVVLVGNLTRDPEMRMTPSGKKVTRFGIAVNRLPYTNEQGERVEGVDFFNISVFGRQAETSYQYLRKGRAVAIDGQLRSRTWETQDGQKRYAVEVNAQNVQFLPRAGEAPNERAFEGAAGIAGEMDNIDIPPIEGGDEGGYLPL